jgi:hypothetical protein
MKKIMFLCILIIVISLVGCSGSEKESELNTNEDTENLKKTTSEKKSSDSDSFKGSIKDLIAKAVPMKCTWNVGTEGMKTQGLIFIKSEKYRTDITTEDMDMHYVSDGEYIYMWNSIQPEGTKMSLKDLEEMGTDTNTDERNSGEMNFDTLDDEYNYKCTPWTVSNSKFSPPSDVKFIDMGEMMSDLQKIGTDMENNPCAACDFLPDGENKDNCLANC